MAKAQATRTPILPADQPGQYGIASPPNRTAELEWVAEEIRQQQGLDGRAGHILDRQLDAKLDQWNADIGQAYVLRLGQLEHEQSRLKANMEHREEELKPRHEECQRAKENLDRAHEALVNSAVHQPSKPPSTAPTQDLALSDTAPIGNTVDRHREYDRAGQLPAGGLTFRDIVHYGVLGTAGVADLVAFYQVLALLLGLYPVLLYSIVGAVTLIALIVMHKAGTTLREIRRREGRPWVATACILAWTLLGAIAFWLRLEIKDDAGESTSLLDFGVVAVGDDTTSTSTTIKAMVFLAIFVTTGVVALVGAYLRHNPLRSRYREALKLYRKLLKRLRRDEAEFKLAKEQLALLDKQIEAEPGLCERARAQRSALACELKAYARTRVAQRLDNPEEVEDLLSRPIPGCGNDA